MQRPLMKHAQMGSQTRRGFSLFEGMIAAGLFGLAVLAGVRLQSTGIHGAANTRATTIARSLAEERREYLTAQGLNALPTCAANGSTGCRQSTNALVAFRNASGGYQCTQYASDSDLPDPTTATPEAKYRLDTVVEAHPDGTRQFLGRILTISVCWQESDGRYQEVLTSRMLSPAE